MKNITMDDVMRSNFGEQSETIRATFKKTINIKQYETEVYESATTLELERPVNGIERMIITSVLQSQLEYAAYVQMYNKGYITGEAFNQRKSALESDLNMLKAKGEELLGKPLDYLFAFTMQAQ